MGRQQRESRDDRNEWGKQHLWSPTLRIRDGGANVPTADWSEPRCDDPPLIRAVREQWCQLASRRKLLDAVESHVQSASTASPIPEAAVEEALSCMIQEVRKLDPSAHEGDLRGIDHGQPFRLYLEEKVAVPFT